MHYALIIDWCFDGTLNPPLNGLIRHMDHYQNFTRPGFWPDLGLVQIWLRSVGRIKRYSQLSAGLSVPSKHHSAMTMIRLVVKVGGLSP